MKKEFNKIESTGWILFMLLMILYVLLMMAMPVPHRDEFDQLEKTWTSNGMIVLTLKTNYSLYLETGTCKSSVICQL